VTVLAHDGRRLKPHLLDVIVALPLIARVKDSIEDCSSELLILDECLTPEATDKGKLEHLLWRPRSVLDDTHNAADLLELVFEVKHHAGSSVLLSHFAKRTERNATGISKRHTRVGRNKKKFSSAHSVR
jgi:hypothetical protein